MSSSFRNPSFGSSSGLLTKGVKWLLIGTTVAFLVQFFCFYVFGQPLRFLKLVPELTMHGFLWQPVTYMFLHDVSGGTHILFNMLSLFFTGPMLEAHWGTERFLKYYFLCGIGAAISVILVSYMLDVQGVATVGCSGAIFGLLVAYGVLFPDVLFFGFIKAKWFVIIMGALNLIEYIAARNAGVSHMAHLGGMLVGYLLIRFGALKTRPGSADPLAWAERQYKDWKLARARKKFHVYMRKQKGRGGYDA